MVVHKIEAKKPQQGTGMHFALEYRGDAATAQKYLDRQNEYFASKGE